MNAIDWGDAPTWVGALFAGGAALFAYQTIRSQRRQISEQQDFIAEQSATMALERAALRAAAEDRRRAQARRVRLHCRLHASRVTQDEEGNPVYIEDCWRVVIHNDSEESIRCLTARFGEGYVAIAAHQLPPSLQRVDDGERLPIPVPVLGPGRRCVLYSSRMSTATLENSRPTLFFTDAGGVQWRLDDHEDLAEVEPMLAE
ncbi:hypothetical protein [Streptomyces monomycini]|uniref:hypothetical protein n=1 Tax=Streptomyces monomycini TaxID=371720 RepID=UPI0004AA387A|nr:hypothetical protein [Streptomyces monomycini]